MDLNEILAYRAINEQLAADAAEKRMKKGK